MIAPLESGATEPLSAENRNREVARLLPFVSRVVARMRIPPNSHDDLVQEAMIALLHKIDRYERGKGPFARWAAYTVRYAVLDHLRVNGGTVVRLNRLQTRARRAAGKDVNDLCISLDDPRCASREGDGGGLAQTLPVRSEIHTSVIERRDYLENALDRLRPRERRVLRLLYPMNGDMPVTIRLAGRLLRISESRVAQIRDEAISRIRAAG